MVTANFRLMRFAPRAVRVVPEAEVGAAGPEAQVERVERELLPLRSRRNSGPCVGRGG